ncbi:uncharacterized protein LOC113148739 [Anabas testudineus]|uniref:uncharacterized protein LOC113148739 n=1 Tax=Anabas testudineus TaxID=64144 RepID=UPI000E45A2CA|nr:uncharacterized protein LOC113148739 [Anabas testudineus]
MGSGTSRGKKVAPASVSEVNVTKTATRSDTSPKLESPPFKPLEIRAMLRDARNSARPPDCHSEGRDSDFSGEDDDGVVDTVLADYEKCEGVSVKDPPPKKTLIKSRTCGLCHFSREDAEDDFGSAAQLRASGGVEEPRGSCGGSRDVNKRSNDAFTHFKKHTPDCPSLHNSSTHGLTRRALLKTVPTSEKQSFPSSSLTMPVILYDGSEEELMDTIEREFS